MYACGCNPWKAALPRFLRGYVGLLVQRRVQVELDIPEMLGTGIGTWSVIDERVTVGFVIHLQGGRYSWNLVSRYEVAGTCQDGGFP